MKGFSKAIEQDWIDEVHGFDHINALLLWWFNFLQAIDDKMESKYEGRDRLQLVDESDDEVDHIDLDKYVNPFKKILNPA